MSGERVQRTDVEKRADKRRFKEQIEACIVAHAALLPRRAWGFLERLATDDDLWTFRALVAGLNDEASGELFWAILKGQELGSAAALRPEREAKVGAHYAELLACVDKLERSYAAAPAGYEPEKVAGLLEGLRFARADLSEGVACFDALFDEYIETRNSKTKATEIANFSTTVTRAMQKAFGRPHHAEVVELTSVVLGETVTEALVRKAWERHG
jgi:hypothetical protein